MTPHDRLFVVAAYFGCAAVPGGVLGDTPDTGMGGGHMSPFYSDESVTLWHGDALTVLSHLPAASVNCVCTSPPYFGLRDYGVDGQIGLEGSPVEYVASLRAVFAEVRRVLADDGVMWLNLGSSYVNGSMPGPQGATGQRATRTFTAEGQGFVDDAARRDAPSRGMAYTTRSGSTAPDSACSGLCDGCAAVPSLRTSRSDQPRPVAAPPLEPTVRDSELQGSAATCAAVDVRDVPASTSLRSAPLPQGPCSHCDNCGACLSVLRSSSRDARLCARKAPHSRGTSSPASGGRSRDMDALGTAWLNYTAALGPKSLIPIPWMVAMSLQTDGWILRNAVVWWKPNAMPESVTDRLSNRYEPVFLFSKSRRYWFDLDPIREPHVTEAYRGGSVKIKSDSARLVNGDVHRGMTRENFLHANGRNPGDVWSIATAPFAEAHFACMPVALAERCIQAGCKPDGTVLDPFSGSGTTGLAAAKHGLRYVGIDLNRDYLALSLRTRLAQTALIEDVTAGFCCESLRQVGTCACPNAVTL